MKELLLPFLIVMLIFLAIGGCDYVLTKKALTEWVFEAIKAAAKKSNGGNNE